MIKKEIICTVCPRGCHVMVEGKDSVVSNLEGFSCQRGRQYAVAEFICPVRILTSTVRIKYIENDLLPVRSSTPIPKDKIFACMEIIRRAEAELPIKRGQVIISNILDTGADIIATKDL